ncbi:MAG TPA: histidine phosphatase family protein [Tepidisphaeraceae bacterium]|nr:histidine phosphatase family protein [Tepidisphaeraceae bacterium]
MRKLILIKHAKPAVIPEMPSHRWELSQEGQRQCEPLAGKIRPHLPELVIASEEPKAAQTGQILARLLGKPFQTAAGLHEHDRSNVAHIAPRDFLSWMAMFFQDRQSRAFGKESAAEAEARILVAVDDVLAAHPQGNLAVVTHGTVLSLLIAARTGEDPYQLYRKMALPSYIVFALPDWTVVERAERVIL